MKSHAKRGPTTRSNKLCQQRKQEELATKDRVSLNIYYKPNPWYQHQSPHNLKVEIFGSFTDPEWQIFLLCDYNRDRHQWYYVVDKPFDKVVKFKFRINGQFQDTSALYFQYTDEQGNYNNIISPWDEIMDPKINVTPSRAEQMLMLQTRIYSAMKHLKMNFKQETQALKSMEQRKGDQLSTGLYLYNNSYNYSEKLNRCQPLWQSIKQIFKELYSEDYESQISSLIDEMTNFSDIDKITHVPYDISNDISTIEKNTNVPSNLNLTDEMDKDMFDLTFANSILCNQSKDEMDLLLLGDNSEIHQDSHSHKNDKQSFASLRKQYNHASTVRTQSHQGQQDEMEQELQLIKKQKLKLQEEAKKQIEIIKCLKIENYKLKNDRVEWAKDMLKLKKELKQLTQEQAKLKEELEKSVNENGSLKEQLRSNSSNLLEAVNSKNEESERIRKDLTQKNETLIQELDKIGQKQIWEEQLKNELKQQIQTLKQRLTTQITVHDQEVKQLRTSMEACKTQFLQVSRQNTLQTLKINQLEDDMRDFKDFKDISKVNYDDHQIVERMDENVICLNIKSKEPEYQIQQNQSFDLNAFDLHSEIKSKKETQYSSASNNIQSRQNWSSSHHSNFCKSDNEAQHARKSSPLSLKSPKLQTGGISTLGKLMFAAKLSSPFLAIVNQNHTQHHNHHPNSTRNSHHQSLL